MSEIDETMKRLTSHEGVQTVVIYNNDGIPIRTAPALENKESMAYPGLFQPLVDKAKKMVKQLDPTNEFNTIRIRSQKNEILVYPEKDYTLVVVQAAA